jgi:hypothetical protein
MWRTTAEGLDGVIPDPQAKERSIGMSRTETLAGLEPHMIDLVVTGLDVDDYDLADVCLCLHLGTDVLIVKLLTAAGNLVIAQTRVNHWCRLLQTHDTPLGSRLAQNERPVLRV